MGHISSTDTVTILFGVFMVLFASGVFINTSWILTNIASIISVVATLFYYSQIPNVKMLQLSFSTTSLLFVVLLGTYISEKRMKCEFA